ncbi:MAG TPA: CNNM domain-containing protein, partial [Thermoanaerobaculia bacterium]|nr:CNNM domain-containing protein [Thermoanaerobaculia bacterium]
MSELMPMAIIALLILANAIFVAAEFAIIGAPRAGIARRAAEGNPVAIRVRSILQDARQQDQYIATAQLGITLASLGLGMYGEHVVASWLLRGIDNITLLDIGTAHVLASIAAVTILTFLHIVLGEMVPKSLALQYA